MLDINGFCDMLVGNCKRRMDELDGINWVYMSYCSKEKIKEEWGWMEERKKYRVIDMYKGWRFDLFRDVVKRRGVDIKDVYVFSGKYGVIGGDVMIEVYDKYFGFNELDEMKERVRDWVKGELEKRGKFGVKYYVSEEIYKKSLQYVKVIVDVMEEMGIECKVIDLVYG